MWTCADPAATVPEPDWCDKPCPGAQPSYTSVGRVVRHLHLRCWLCDGDVISSGRYYFCTSCQAGGGPGVASATDSSYDPEVAAALPSPA